MYKWYKEELYIIVISILIMNEWRNCDINLEFCTSNKWSSQVYVYNKTTKIVFLNTLITHKKNNIESFIQFLWNIAFNTIHYFNYKEVLGTTPTPSGTFKLTLSYYRQWPRRTTTLSQIPATNIIVRIAHSSTPFLTKQWFLDSYMVYQPLTRFWVNNEQIVNVNQWKLYFISKHYVY